MDEVFGRRDGKPRLSLSGTHNSYPLSMVAGLATLKQLSPELYEHLDQTGALLRKGLSQLVEDHGILSCVNGIQSLVNIYFGLARVDRFRDAQLTDSYLRWIFDLSMLANGVYLAPSHFFCVSAATSSEDVEATLRASNASIKWIKKLYPKLTAQ